MNPYIYTGLPEKLQYYSRKGILATSPIQIIEAVSSVLSVKYHDIIGKSRLRTVVEARHIAIGLIANAQPNLLLREIGVMFGNRDHSTIIYSKENFIDLYTHNKPFREKVDKVKKLTHLI